MQKLITFVPFYNFIMANQPIEAKDKWMAIVNPDSGFEHLFDSQSLSTPYGNTGGFTSADGTYMSNDDIANEVWAHREARHQALEQGDFNIIEVIAALDITQRINNEIAISMKTYNFSKITNSNNYFVNGVLINNEN